MNRRHMLINLLRCVGKLFSRHPYVSGLQNPDTTKWRVAISLFSLLLAVPLQALGADYGQMKDQFKNYDSPAYYKSNLAVGQSAAQETIVPASELTLKQEELAKLKARWDSLIEKASADKSLFDFESEQAQGIIYPRPVSAFPYGLTRTGRG